MKPRRSPCDGARRLLDERLDRRLSPFEGDALAAHLEECAACRAEAAAAEAVDAFLAADAPPEEPPHFTDRVIASLDRAPAGEEDAPPPAAGPRFARALAAAVGTAALAALVVAVLPAEALAAPLPPIAVAVPSIPLPELPAPVAALVDGASASLRPASALAVAVAAAAAAALLVASMRPVAGRRAS